MNYQIPPKPAEPKPRYVVITDPLEIESIQRAGLRDIIGKCENGVWYGESHSVDQFRGKPVEITV